jgi:hypothetical protein
VSVVWIRARLTALFVVVAAAAGIAACGAAKPQRLPMGVVVYRGPLGIVANPHGGLHFVRGGRVGVMVECQRACAGTLTLTALSGGGVLAGPAAFTIGSAGTGSRTVTVTLNRRGRAALHASRGPLTVNAVLRYARGYGRAPEVDRYPLRLA